MEKCFEGIDAAEAAIANSPDNAGSWEVAARLYAIARRENSDWLPKSERFWKRFFRSIRLVPWRGPSWVSFAGSCGKNPLNLN
jgi:hypothetical protein